MLPLLKFNIQSAFTWELFNQLVNEDNIRPYLKSLADFHLETFEHIQRVCMLCLDLGIENGLNRADLHCLGYAGLLHDIGKTKIPRDILTKPEELEPQEYQLMQDHVRLGFAALENFAQRRVREIVAAHHEFSAKPYPRDGIDRRRRRRPRGDRRQVNRRIQKLAQILALADMFDALTQPRAYKEAFTRQKAEEILGREFFGDYRFIEQALRRWVD